MPQTIARIEHAIAAEGFAALGSFHVNDGDDVPALADGRPAATLVLVGNAGSDMWQRFEQERKSDTPTLDTWSARVLSRLAGHLGACALFPFETPPLPFQRWATRAGRVHTSPLGMSIHNDHGLWHAYRAAFAFPQRIALPPGENRASPCATCADKPCLTACPVGAFSGSGYDVAACAAHIGSPQGADCIDLGCRARRACPVGRDYTYAPAQARFHMTAFLRARPHADGN